jgi:hypothetical protein
MKDIIRTGIAIPKGEDDELKDSAYKFIFLSLPFIQVQKIKKIKQLTFQEMER